MAPEIYHKRAYDQSVDIWSLGCSFFELYTRFSLFDPPVFQTPNNQNEIIRQRISNFTGLSAEQKAELK